MHKMYGGLESSTAHLPFRGYKIVKNAENVVRFLPKYLKNSQFDDIIGVEYQMRGDLNERLHRKVYFFPSFPQKRGRL